jgi:transcriptional regulator with XRE-family HTH domain
MDPADLLGRRKALRMSQAELGRALGVARNTLARWERGELEMRHAELIALALDRLEAEESSATVGIQPTNLPAELSTFVGARRGARWTLPTPENKPAANTHRDRRRRQDAPGHSTRARGYARLSRRRLVCRSRTTG